MARSSRPEGPLRGRLDGAQLASLQTTLGAAGACPIIGEAVTEFLGGASDALTEAVKESLGGACKNISAPACGSRGAGGTAFCSVEGVLESGESVWGSVPGVLTSVHGVLSSAGNILDCVQAFFE